MELSPYHDKWETNQTIDYDSINAAANDLDIGIIHQSIVKLYNVHIQFRFAEETLVRYF